MTIEQIEKVERVKPFIDYLVNRIISRKFIVFIVATWLVREGKIEGIHWALFAGLYISTLVFLKLLEFMTKKQERNLEHFGHRGKKDDKPIDTKIIPEES